MYSHRPIDKNDKKIQICWSCSIKGCNAPITHHLQERDENKHGYNIIVFCDEHYKIWKKENKC